MVCIYPFVDILTYGVKLLGVVMGLSGLLAANIGL